MKEIFFNKADKVLSCHLLKKILKAENGFSSRCVLRWISIKIQLGQNECESSGISSSERTSLRSFWKGEQYYKRSSSLTEASKEYLSIYALNSHDSYSKSLAKYQLLTEWLSVEEKGQVSLLPWLGVYKKMLPPTNQPTVPHFDVTT